MRRKTASGHAFDTSLYAYPGDELEAHWARLHEGDREPYPSMRHVARLAKGNAAVGEVVSNAGGAAAAAGALQEAWRAFHSGEFAHAVKAGTELGAPGATAANKAAAILSLYLEKDERKRISLLRHAIERGEEALEALPDCANVHYTLALVLGRYSQRISIVNAVAEGLASRIRDLLERTLELEPRHAEAHVALGLYHCELVKTVGGLLAGLTYGASHRAAIEHFQKAIKLAPGSAIAHVEYAHGLLLLDAEGSRPEIDRLCARAAALEPHDAMEHFDVERARRNCARG